MTSSPLRVIVVGGSLAGLFAASLLVRQGCRVTVCERVPEPLAGRGAGIMTHPTLIEALRRCGISEAETVVGVPIVGRLVVDRSGALVGTHPKPQVATSWGRLYSMLRASVPEQCYRQGMALESFVRHDGGVEARFANGEAIEADVLIAADGIRSTVRAQCLPDTRPAYAGYIAWRGLVDESDLSPATHALLFDRLGFCLPPGEQMLGYPVAGRGESIVPGKRSYNFVWYRPADASTVLPDLLTDAGGRRHEFAIPPPLIRPELVERIRAEARTLLAPQFAEVVAAAPNIFFQPIYDLESPQLAFGRIALIGDAAFTARPHIGMGVAKAAEDAMAIADALAGFADPITALSHYDASRQPAGSAVIERARHLGAYMQAQWRTPEERAMAEAFRTPEAIMRETAVPPPWTT